MILTNNYFWGNSFPTQIGNVIDTTTNHFTEVVLTNEITNTVVNTVDYNSIVNDIVGGVIGITFLVCATVILKRII